VSGRLVHDAVLSHGGSSCYVADKAMLPEVLAGQVRPGDLVITLGAGDISLIGSLLLPLLQDADA
jgi:UDP-N-acetylmuramate--L-alanine ligase